MSHKPIITLTNLRYYYIHHHIYILHLVHPSSLVLTMLITICSLYSKLLSFLFHPKFNKNKKEGRNFLEASISKRNQGKTEEKEREREKKREGGKEGGWVR